MDLVPVWMTSQSCVDLYGVKTFLASRSAEYFLHQTNIIELNASYYDRALQ